MKVKFIKEMTGIDKVYTAGSIWEVLKEDALHYHIEAEWHYKKMFGFYKEDFEIVEENVLNREYPGVIHLNNNEYELSDSSLSVDSKVYTVSYTLVDKFITGAKVKNNISLKWSSNSKKSSFKIEVGSTFIIEDIDEKCIKLQGVNGYYGKSCFDILEVK